MPLPDEPLTQAHAIADPRGWQYNRLRRGLAPLTFEQMVAIRAGVQDGHRPAALARAFHVRVQFVRWVAVARVVDTVTESERHAEMTAAAGARAA